MSERSLLLALVSLAVATSPIHANLITVNTTVDEFGDSPSSGCSLREAVHAANTDAAFGGCAAGHDADLILIGAGTYALTRLPSLPDDGSSGDLHVTDEVEMVGAATIDAGQIDRIFDIAKTAGTVTLQGLTLRNGDPDGLPDSGGAILTHESVGLVLDSVTIENNRAGGGGGIALFPALAGDPPTAVPTFDFEDVTLNDNEAFQTGGAVHWSTRGSGAVWECLRCSIETNQAAAGGGIVALVTPLELATLRFEDSHLLDNTSSNANRGGISIPPTGSAAVHLTNTEMHGNQGVGATKDGFYSESPIATLFVTGGAISDTLYFVDGGAAVVSGATFANGSFGAIYSLRNTMVELDGVRFEDNTSQPALYLGEGSSATVQGSVFVGNLKGGVQCDDCNLIVSRSAFVDNLRSGDGGAGVRVLGVAAEASFRNVTFSGNRTLSSNGGGLALEEGADFLLNNVTVTANQASSAGGLYVGPGAAAPEMSNTILAGNTQTGGAASDCGGSILSIGHNLIGNADSCSITPTAGDQTGTAAQPLAAGLAPLTTVNGQPVHGLLLGSAALDHGDNGSCQTIDQTGQPRPLDGGGGLVCDIGAREEPNPSEPALFTDGFESGDTTAWN